MTQWKFLLKNLGIWDGSFTHVVPSGEQVDDVQSRVSLEGLADNRQVRQTIQMLSPDRQTITSERVLTYGSLNRSVLVFETGAFSQGAIQYGPFSEFGAELGFIEGDRRLRLVQLFNKEAQLATITLIREHRQGTQAVGSAVDQLSVDHWVGDWQGTATTLFPDWSPPYQDPVECQVWREGDRLVEESRGAIGFPLSQAGTSAQTQRRIWRMDASTGTYTRLVSLDTSVNQQALLLPGGTLSITPTAVPRQHSFALEACWFTAPTQRQRMLRYYDAAGAWTALTLVHETLREPLHGTT